MSPAGWAVMAAAWFTLITLAVWGVSRLFPTRAASSPRAALDEWLASGTIDAEMYGRLRADLDTAGPNRSSRPW
ncbi:MULTISPECIES: hypothetical protein [unclassified Cellulomonas]|uniref:hypothetical protein n=1 Tax=unclassified Cellulomonas TaxID=2620175 RepID=UPI001EF3BBDF|nr:MULTISPECIES: hypothetical protein [unclassified Cellulomonas]MCG7284689.1 hypothetical protein [Cellulomonas sp. ACRRI]